jgi:hypothetical protein
MPLFLLTENRYIHTDQVTDCDYKPAIGESEYTQAAASHLRIELRNGEEILSSGKEADDAWGRFKAAIESQTKAS